MYAVAESDPTKAMELLSRDFIGGPKMEDLGRVNAALLDALNILAGRSKKI